MISLKLSIEAVYIQVIDLRLHNKKIVKMIVELIEFSGCVFLRDIDVMELVHILY